MSHCPYGTQIEKGILLVFRALGNKIDAQFKFVNYAMHEETELAEQLRQYCIMTKEPQKFYDYRIAFSKAVVRGRAQRRVCKKTEVLTSR